MASLSFPWFPRAESKKVSGWAGVLCYCVSDYLGRDNCSNGGCGASAWSEGHSVTSQLMRQRESIPFGEEGEMQQLRHYMHPAVHNMCIT